MAADARRYSLPRWRLTRWLADPGTDVPGDIRVALVSSLYGTLPIFFGGVFNTILVSLLITLRLPHIAFFGWLLLEIMLCVTRLGVLLHARRAADAGRRTPTDIYLLLSVCWAASVGYGTFISLISGDWVSATLACLSAAAMVGGICFRNYSAPRLAGTMIVLSLGACCVAAPFTGEWLMIAALLQIPVYLYAMSSASYQLNKMLITTMQGEREYAYRAVHDVLTGLSNRAGLMRAMEAKWALPAAGQSDFSLLYLDLDGFKAVNDTQGHHGGDRLLTMVAERLSGLAHAGDVAARIGGDEFVVLSLTTNRAQISAFAERLIHEIAQPYEGGASIGVSIGIALSGEHPASFDAVLQAADEALYRAKASGKLCYRIAEPAQPAPEPASVLRRA
jgi:diguanylate cyclase (GGDEF)-like protein